VLKAVVILAAGLAGAALAVVPALADSQTVTAGSSTFDKTQVAIRPGESVTFSNPAVGGGFHNLFVDGNQVEADGTGWSYTASGLSPGQHSFECKIHAAMKGTIYVNDAGTVPATTTTGTTTGPSTTTGPTTTTGTSPAPPPGTQAPTLTLPKHALGTFRRPAVTFAVVTDEDATLHLTLSRRAPGTKRFRRFGTAVAQVTTAANPNRVRVTRASGKRLVSGAYRMSVVATDAQGESARATMLSFAIR
jgi:plastocyanin